MKDANEVKKTRMAQQENYQRKEEDMQGKLKDARAYSRVSRSWPSSIYVVRSKRNVQKTIRKGTAKDRRDSA